MTLLFNVNHTIVLSVVIVCLAISQALDPGLQLDSTLTPTTPWLTLTPTNTPSPTLTPTNTPTRSPTTFEFTQQAQFYGLDGDDYYEGQAYSVSISGNGDLVAFASEIDSETGSAWVYERLSNGAWQSMGAKIKVDDSDDGFGASVSLSTDGSLLAVGQGDGVGGAYLFTRSGSTWVQTAKLVGTGAAGNSQQGESVSLSGDGTTLAVGGPFDNSAAGAVWVFVRAENGTWVQQGEKLLGTGAVGDAFQGVSVSLSADGNTMASGGMIDNTFIGATWIFVRAGNGTWSQLGDKLVGTGGVGLTYQGTSVSLSADGDTLAVGGNIDDSEIGAVWIFVRADNGTWSQQGEKLVGAGAVGAAAQGASVSLSADGNMVAVGGPSDDSSIGATWVFVRADNGTWSQLGDKLFGDTTSPGEQGKSVALASVTKDTIAVGAPFDQQRGGVWIFARAPAVSHPPTPPTFAPTFAPTLPEY